MALQDRQIWVDGALVPFADAQVHLLSQSLQRGTLIFDVMPVYRTAGQDCVLGLREHVERFFGSARLNQMELRIDEETVIAAIGETVRANPRSNIIKVSGYFAGISLDILPVDSHASVAIAALDESELHPGFQPRPPPARLQISASPKMPASVLSPQVKIAASYTHAAIAKRHALADGFDDVLFLDSGGRIAESSTSSFFLVIDGRVCSGPLETVLAGVTRRAVIDLAREESLEVAEGPMAGDWLERADEAFLTGTTTEVRPVSRIDALELVAPGPISARLRARFDRMTAGDDPLSERWMQPV